jgi:hypothetical protein
MAKFLDCVCDNNLNALIKEGTATQKELSDCFNLLLSEYSELRGDTTNGKQDWMLGREITRTHNHLELLRICIEFLRVRYSSSIAESLNKLGYRFKPTDTNPEAYAKLLDNAIARSKTKYIELLQMQDQLKKLNENKSKDYKKPMRKNYERTLMEIEEMQHASYNMDTISVAKYVMLENKYVEKIEYLLNRKIA